MGDHATMNGKAATASGDGGVSRREFIQASAGAIGAAMLLHGDRGAAATGGQAAPRALVLPRAPLAVTPFVAIPLGSVRARGWARRQLELQRDGLTGHAEEVLPSLTPRSSAWLGNSEGEDWEKGPYYAKGLVALAFTLGDETLQAKARRWIDAILSSQRDDGFYGPQKNNDWWPRMVSNYLLRDYAEATGDERIAPFLARYYRHLGEHLPQRPLREWGKARAGDEIETLFWLYNRNGDESLLSVADLLHAQAYPWREIYAENRFLEYPADFHPKHAVNVAQALKMPVVYWQRSGDARDRKAYRAGLEHLLADHGTSYGINTGTEFVSGRSTVEGVELCAIVENMLSAATALRILGEARIGDELERVAFNALPAAMTRDLRQHVYYILANNVAAVRGRVGYEIDYEDGRTPAPRSGCPCCCYNLHMGWPKLVQNAWAGTASGGLALLAYVPSEVTTRVAKETTANVVCDTNYPFEDSIVLRIGVDQPATFPLHLRIPGWCQAPSLSINGAQQPAPASGGFAVVERQWQDGDVVRLRFPMEVEVVRGVLNTASVQRGPLVYSLALTEKWTPLNEGKVPGFDSLEATTESPWNYALELGDDDPAKPMEVVTRPIDANPFESRKSPVSLMAKARRVEAWKIRSDGLIPLDPPPSPVKSDAAAETIELVPFGLQMLKITDFPVLGQPTPPATEWREDFAPGWGERWIVYRGGSVRDGRLHLPRAAKGIATSTRFSDFTYEGEVTVSERGDAGLMFRVAEPSIGIDHYRGYYAGIDSAAGTVVFGKSDYKWLPLAKNPMPIAADKPHRIRVEARGEVFRIFIDDAAEPALEVSDETFKTGAVGVRSFADRAAFMQLAARAV